MGAIYVNPKQKIGVADQPFPHDSGELSAYMYHGMAEMQNRDLVLFWIVPRDIRSLELKALFSMPFAARLPRYAAS